MIRKSLALCAVTALFMLAGCGDDHPSGAAQGTTTTAAKPATTAAAATTTSAATTAAVAASDDDIPSEADFEEEAEKDISVDNLEAEIGKLEKEIGP